MPDTTSGDTADGGRTAEGLPERDGSMAADPNVETHGPWFQSRGAVAVVAVDALLTLGLAAGTTAAVGGPLAELAGVDGATGVLVPWWVYVFAALGAFAYVFTGLVRDFDRSALGIARYHLRVPAAVPLAAGTYLLADLILGTGSGGAGTPALVAGLAFVSGLFVDLAYERLAALSERLLPDRSGDGEEPAADCSCTCSGGQA